MRAEAIAKKRIPLRGKGGKCHHLIRVDNPGGMVRCEEPAVVACPRCFQTACLEHFETHNCRSVNNLSKILKERQ